MAHDPTAVDWLQIDADNRLQAIDPQGSFIVEAPAGAGKTELLTQRFLGLLARVNEPEEIVALTFTNKAAAEMRQRILDNLQGAQAGVPPAEPHRQQTYALAQAALSQDRARGWGLLSQSTRLQVTTLDALCGRLARQMPLLSRLGSQPAIATDATPFYTQAAQATLQRLDSSEPLADVLERVLAAMDHDTAQLQALLVRMLANRDQWLRHARSGIDLGRAEAALHALVSEELAGVTLALRPALQEALMPAARYVGQMAAAVTPATPESTALARLADWQQPLAPTPQHLPTWRALCDLLLTQKGDVRARPPNGYAWSSPAGKGVAEGFKTVLETLRQDVRADQLQRLRTLPQPLYSETEVALIADLMAVLKHATAQLWLAFQAAGQVDFTQMAQNALLALGEPDAPTDLQLQLDHRLSHLLVDEFQDTSPTQVDLLVRLTSGWQAGDGRTLFLVGDPMQSIYRFRKADVGLFIQARDQGLGPWRLTPLQLYRNNRSHPEVVDWVNAVFPQVFSPRDDFHRGAVRFVPAQATRPPLPQAGVWLHAVWGDGPSAEPAQATEADGADDEGATGSADEREARCVLQQIDQALQDDPDGSVAVLVRARKHLRPLVAALRRHRPDLRVQAVEIEPLAQRQVIQDLMALTRALHHRSDRVHWLAVLRAPWCGLTLADLHALVADDRRTVWALMHDDVRLQRMSADGQARLAHARAVLAQALAHQGRARPRRWVEGTWQALGGPLCLRHPGDLADVQAFWQVLDRLDRHGTLDLTRLPAELDALYAAPDPLASGQVQVMTIHKSKGLEFDTVIVPGLHRKSSLPERPLLLWDEVIGPDGEEDLVVAALPAQAQDDHGPGKFRYLQAFEAERATHEARRLLYVAVTRARRRLHLVAVLQAKDGQVTKPVADSLLALLWPPLANAWEAALPADERSGGAADDEAPGSQTRRMPLADYAHQLERLRMPAVPAALQATATDHPAGAGHHGGTDEAALHPAAMEQADAAVRQDPGDRLATDTGVLVHRLLERVARDGLAQWPDARLQGLRPTLRQWLLAQGHAADDASQGAADALQHLLGTCQSEQGRWVLADHPEAACELALGSAGADGVQQHVIDRTFVHQGVRWIIDYKTGALLAGPEADDATLRAQLARHLPQLQRYRQLWPTDEPVQLAILVTRWGRLVTWPDSP